MSVSTVKRNNLALLLLPESMIEYVRKSLGKGLGYLQDNCGAMDTCVDIIQEGLHTEAQRIAGNNSKVYRKTVNIGLNRCVASFKKLGKGTQLSMIKNGTITMIVTLTLRTRKTL